MVAELEDVLAELGEARNGGDSRWPERGVAGGGWSEGKEKHGVRGKRISTRTIQLHSGRVNPTVACFFTKASRIP